MFNTKFWQVSIFVVAQLFISSLLQAEVYHCRGRVVRFPCSAIVQSSGDLSFGARQKGAKIKREVLETAVTDEALKKLPKNQGLWAGRVKGTGLIKLKLLIYRAGELESVREMGQVVLNDKSTAFNFKSSLPPGEGWSWKIQASNG